MSIKGDAITLVVVGAVAVGALWYLKGKVTGGLSAAGGAISSGASAAWNTATTPVLDLGSGAVGSAVADLGNGIVAAPANTADALSLGLIGGSGGNTGNGGIGSWLWNLVNGSAFAPAGATDSTPLPIDYGNGTGGW